eukprot:Sdes_comp18306_c0_seq1m8016
MILYSLIAFENIILVEFCLAKGNFQELARQILDIIRKNTESKMSYLFDDYLFHYFQEDGFIFMCLAEENFGRRLPFAFLQEIKNLFQIHASSLKSQMQTSSSTSDTKYAPVPYSYQEIFQEALAEQMHYFSSDNVASRLDKVRSEMKDVRNIMVTNIEKVLARGEKIDLLVDKTDELQNRALRFNRNSKNLRDKKWWKTFKCKILLSLFILACLAGGFYYFWFDWK